MRNLLIILSFLTLKATCVTIPVSSPGIGKDIYFSIQEAVNAAKSGDVIMLPKGQFTFSNRINVNKKKITISGQGNRNTVLYRSESTSDATILGWGALFELTSDSTTISGITLKSKRPSLISGDGFSNVMDCGIKVNYVVGFKISDCRFENFGNAAIEVRHRDTLANGLITGCEFYSNYKGEDGSGLGYGVAVYGEGKTWVKSPKLGSSNFIFIENNKFDGHRHAVASAGCGLYVCRYNIADHSIVSGPYIHCFDTHDGRGPGNGVNSFGSRATEIYNNTITNSTFINGDAINQFAAITSITEKAIAIRSGDAVVYNNTISGFRFGIGLLNSYTSQPENVELYYWGNIFTPYNSNPAKTSVSFYNYNTTYYVAGRDYFGVQKQGYTAYKYPY